MHRIKFTDREKQMSKASATHKVLLKSSAVIMAATLLSRVFGLVRTKVVNYYFTQELLDPFWYAYKIPNTFRELLGEGALSAAFIPVFTSFLVKYGDEESSKLGSNVLNILAATVLVLAGAGMLCAKWFMPVYLTGLAADTARLVLAVDLTSIMMPFLLCASIGAVIMGILNGKKHFFAPAFAPILSSIGMITTIALFHKAVGPHILGWGVLIGGLCQLCFQIPFLRGRGFRYSFSFNLRHPGVQEVLRLMVPAAMALGVVQLNQLIAPFFASYFRGGMAALQNSILLVQMPHGVFAIALSTALLPALSEHATRGDNDAFRKSISDGLGLVLLFSIPSALFLLFMGPGVIDAVFIGGKFTTIDLERTARALFYHSFGLIGMGGTVLANRFFYSLRDMRTPFIVAILSVLLNLICNIVFHLLGLGFALIALSNSIAVTANFITLLLLVQKRIGRFQWRTIFLECGRITTASCAFVATSILIWNLLAQAVPDTFLWKLTRLGISGAGGGMLFLMIARLLGIREISMVAEYINRRLRGKGKNSDW